MSEDELKLVLDKSFEQSFANLFYDYNSRVFVILETAIGWFAQIQLRWPHLPVWPDVGIKEAQNWSHWGISK